MESNPHNLTPQGEAPLLRREEMEPPLLGSTPLTKGDAPPLTRIASPPETGKGAWRGMRRGEVLSPREGSHFVLIIPSGGEEEGVCYRTAKRKIPNATQVRLGDETRRVTG